MERTIRKTKDKENDPVWKQFREHAEKVLNLKDVTILDKIAVYSTLDAVSKGFSKKEIAKMLELTENDVEEDLSDFGNFEGFETTCDLSPIKVFRNSREQFINIFQYHSNMEFAQRLESFLEKFTKLQDDLDNYYNGKE